jgi:dynein heavy chain
LDSIKKRLQQTNRYIGGQVIREKVKNPLFKADIILAIPNISIKPTLDDMQSQLNKSIQAMLRMSQDLPEWQHAIKLKDLQIKVVTIVDKNKIFEFKLEGNRNIENRKRNGFIISLFKVFIVFFSI